MRRPSAAVASTLLLSLQTLAQSTCPPQLQPGTPADFGLLPIFEHLTLWDSDGPGPAAPALLAVGGDNIGGVAGTRSMTARLESGQWQQLGQSALPSSFAPSVVSPGADGTLFTTNSGVGSAQLVNGTWTHIGGQVSPDVFRTVATLTQSRAVYGGAFTHLDGLPVANVALWDAGAWRAMGSGLPGADSLDAVSALLVLPDQSVVAGGSFLVDGVRASVARWNGSTWTALPGAPSRVTRLLLRADGRIVAQSPGTPTPVVVWNGQTWTPLALPPQFTTTRIFEDAAGRLLLAGTFSSASGPSHVVLREQNGAWLQLGQPLDAPPRQVLEDPDGTLLVATDIASRGARLWWLHDNVWRTDRSGSDDFITQVEAFSSTSTLVYGFFSRLDGVPVSRIAEWTPDGFGPVPGLQQLPTSLISTPVGALHLSSDGAMLAWGNRTINGQAHVQFARWSGGVWTPERALPLSSVHSTFRRADGRVLVSVRRFPPASDYEIWQRTVAGSWQFVGTVFAPTSGWQEMPDGSVVMATSFFGPFLGSISPFGTYSSLASPAGFNGSIQSLTALPDGSLVVGGSFTQPYSRVARIVASTASPMGAGLPFDVIALRSLPGGDLLAAGYPGIARWSIATQSWSMLPFTFSDRVRDMDLRDGVIFVGGDFLTVNGQPSAFFARIDLNCPQGCDSIDFNNNTVFPEDQDVIDFFSVLSGATCATCNDIDFNNNTVFPEDQDVIDFFSVLAGGACP